MNKIQKLSTMLVVASGLFSITPALASGSVNNMEILNTDVGGALGLSSQDIRITVARMIRVAMQMLGIIVVVIILYGGFVWMTAGGNDEKITEAKKWIFSGIVGLAIILSSYAIATFVIGSLVNATGGGAVAP